MTRKICFFTVMTALFLLAAPSLRAAQSGTCGDNVTWTIDDEGVLTIEGTGAMTDYVIFSPWQKLSPIKAIIGDGVTTIGNCAFYECTGLTSVTIPNSVTSIGEKAFAYCSGLESITVDAGNSTYDSRDNCNAIIETKTNILIAGCQNTTIPSSVTSIGNSAFASCSGLTSVTIPNSVTNIKYYAFANCTGLEKIESLAETPPTCGSDAFYNVDKKKCVLSVPRKSINAYKTATEWKDFTNINALAKGTCGDSVTWTLDDQGVLTLEGTGAMTDYGWDTSPWQKLSPTKALIKDGVTTIGDYAFQGCKGLTSVTIPNSVTSIGYYAFYGCTGLTSVTIPASVTSIGAAAFYGCTGMTSVTIPASVTSIGEVAFSYCSGLEKIESLAETPPVCGSGAFWEVDKNKCVLSVPEKSINAYKAAEGWKDFLQIISGIGGVAQESNAGVSARNGEITVTGVADNAVVEVYSTSGALVYRGASKTVSVPSAGIYIVKAAGRTFKVKTTR